MNIAKKLLFALLLCGATFAVACEDEGGGTDNNGAATGTAAVGAMCEKGSTDKTKLCATGLACVADSAGATSGKCATKCNAVADNDATCAGKDATKNACAEKDGVDGKVNVCVKPTTGPQPVVGEANAGDSCTTDSTDKTKKCKGDLVCVTSTASDTNEGKCSIVCSTNTDCATARPATHCGDLFKQGKADGQKACTLPTTGPQPVPFNKECNKKTGADAKTCATGLVCVGATDNAETGTCKTVCKINKDCTDEKEGTACKDVLAAKVVAASQADTKVCDAP